MLKEKIAGLLAKMAARIVTQIVGLSPQELVEAYRAQRVRLEQQQSPKRQTRYTYTDGPMIYLGQQIVKAMQDSGYPAMIVEGYRSPERQAELYARRPRVTKAGPYESAHQFWEAVDIVHPTLLWNASADYWEQLAVCVRIVSEKHRVALVHGHHWSFVDSAHIETPDWRQVRERYRRDPDEVASHPYPEPYRVPTPEELGQRFRQLLPQVWAQAQR